MRGDHVFLGRGQQHVGFQEHGFVAIDILAAGEIHNGAGFLAMLRPAPRYRGPAALYTAPSYSTMQTILYPARAISLAAMPPTLPKPWITTRVCAAFQAEAAQSLIGDDHASAAGGFAAPARSAQVDGLARDHGGLRVAGVHRVGVHDPGHGLLIGVHVGSGDVDLRPDEIEQLGGIAARDALQLAGREQIGIADHAALAAAERDVDHRAFPGHPATPARGLHPA